MAPLAGLSSAFYATRALSIRPADNFCRVLNLQPAFALLLLLLTTASVVDRSKISYPLDLLTTACHFQGADSRPGHLVQLMKKGNKEILHPHWYGLWQTSAHSSLKRASRDTEEKIPEDWKLCLLYSGTR